jgi:hypothetical protein
MPFLPSRRPASQRESMIATIILAAMMMSGPIYALTAPLDWIVLLAIAVCIVMYVGGTIAVLVLQKRQPESAYNLFRVQVPPSACMAILAYMIRGIARHPHDLLPLLK